MKYIKNNIVYDEYRGIPNEDGKLVLGMTRAEILSLGYAPFLGNDLTDDGRTSKYQLEPYYIDFYSLSGETEALTREVVLDTDLDDAIKAYEDGRELIIRYWGELPDGVTDLQEAQEGGEIRINAVYYFSNVESGNLIFRSSFPVNMIDPTRYTKSNYNCVTISTGTNPKVLSFYPASDTFVSVSQVAELVEEEYVDLTKNAQGNIIVNSGSSSVDVADYVRYVESSSPNVTRIFRKVSSKSESGGPMSISGNTASYVFSEINGTNNSTNILVCTLGQGSVAGGDWELKENIVDLTNYYTKTQSDARYTGINNNPIIEDTRSSSVVAITGVAPFASLVDKQRIILHSKYMNTGSGAYTLNLTLNDGNTTTGAKNIKWISATDTWNNATGNKIRSGVYLQLVYDSTKNAWLINQDYDTTYEAISASEVTGGSATTGRLISAKVLRDNFYTEGEVDDLLGNITVPTATSDLTNDSGFLGDADVSYDANTKTLIIGSFNEYTITLTGNSASYVRDITVNGESKTTSDFPLEVDEGSSLGFKHDALTMSGTVTMGGTDITSSVQTMQSGGDGTFGYAYYVYDISNITGDIVITIHSNNGGAND
jgi:hypothetical protein